MPYVSRVVKTNLRRIQLNQYLLYGRLTASWLCCVSWYLSGGVSGGLLGRPYRLYELLYSVR